MDGSRDVIIHVEGKSIRNKDGMFERSEVLLKKFKEIGSIFISGIDEGNNLVVIVGDLNYPDVNWADAMYTTPTSGKFIYLRIYFLISMVRKVSDEETLYI